MERVDPLAGSFFQDPYPIYAALRREDPVHRSARGAWLISRYEDVVKCLGDGRLGNAPSPIATLHARNAARYTSANVAAQILPFQDPPAHTTQRRIVARCFQQQLKDKPLDLSTAAQRHLSACAERAELDVLADFATPYSVDVMCELVGFPVADAERLKSWSEAFFFLLSIIPSAEKRKEIDAALDAFRAYVTTLLHERVRDPQRDLLTRFAQSLSVEAAVDNCMLVFADGIENVDRGIANCMLSLLTHPQQWRALCADPALTGDAVEECLRFESPAQFIARTALCSFELQGRRIQEGETVLLLLGSANRDADAFVDASTLDLRRAPNPHVGFGRGAHACIGGRLAVAQMSAAVTAISRQLPEVKLAAATHHFLPRTGHRWLGELRVRRD